MGFMLLTDTAEPFRRQDREAQLLSKLGCQVCPLNGQPGRMPATGTERPLVYMIGEAPGAEEIERHEQFVGSSGRLLRPLIPRRFASLLRWDNVCRCRPPNNRTPEQAEIEACRFHTVKEVERSRPKAIFGFGAVPLRWASGFSGMYLWRGRRMPIFVGEHPCWYYAFVHPAYILRLEHPDEDERMLALDLERAFGEIEHLPSAQPHRSADVHIGVEVLQRSDEQTLGRIEQLLARAAKAPEIGIDYETTSLNPYAADSKILTAAVSTGDHSFAFGFDHPDCQWPPALRKRLGEAWRQFLLRAEGVKAAHNLAFELEWTGLFFGTDLIRTGRWEDTQSQACILDERTGKNRGEAFSLEFLVQQHFGVNIKELANINRDRLADEPLERVLYYNGPDAKYHLLLWQRQRDEINRLGLQHPYHLALRRVPTVVLSQIKGVPVDQSVVVELSTKYDQQIKQVEAEIAAMPVIRRFEKKFARPFDPGKDVLRLFHELLECRECWVIDKYTKKRKLSASEEVLEQIAPRYPVADLILKLRGLRKLKSTYIDPLNKDSPDTVIHPDGLLHPRFNTVFAETGRLSSSSPNMQNFPKRDSTSKEIRRAIRCAPDEYIVACDYGQIEARVIAMYTKDKRFVDALWNGFDVHGDWAERIATDYPARIGGKQNLTDKKVMKEFRNDVKNQWTFPLFFGARLESVAGYLDIPEYVLRPHFNAFWREFDGVKKWQEQQIAFYKQHGYVECLTGRRRHGPLSTNQILNSGVQGSAAEIVMDAMARLSETGDPLLQPEINIHDDLTFLRVPIKRFDELAERVLDMMLDVPFEWAKIVPIQAEIAVGQDWEDMKEVGKFSSHEWGR